MCYIWPSTQGGFIWSRHLFTCSQASQVSGPYYASQQHIIAAPHLLNIPSGALRKHAAAAG